MRIVLGVIAGFIAWSIVWVGSEGTLGRFWSEFAEHSAAAERAFVNGEALNAPPIISVANLVRSFITSIIGGYIAALVSGEYRRVTMFLGAILVVVGVGVEYMCWNLAPAWYHIIFVLMLYPMTVLGGRLRRPN
jgi:hypothetical protein